MPNPRLDNEVANSLGYERDSSLVSNEIISKQCLKPEICYWRVRLDTVELTKIKKSKKSRHNKMLNSKDIDRSSTLWFFTDQLST